MLLGLMQERLLIMHDVARWKWQAGMPITDPKREEALIERTVEEARRHDLDADMARGFMRAQIEAGKKIQQADFDAWRASGAAPTGEIPDLDATLRPKIDRLGPALIASLARLTPQLVNHGVPQAIRERAQQVLRGEGIDNDIRALAILPLLDVRWTMEARFILPTSSFGVHSHRRPRPKQLVGRRSRTLATSPSLPVPFHPSSFRLPTSAPPNWQFFSTPCRAARSILLSASSGDL